jgi:AraC family transcriptional activator of pobA
MADNEKQIPVHSIKTKEMGPFGFGVINLIGKGNKGYDSTVLHRHTFFELLFFRGGQGTHEIDFQHFPIEGNSVHFVSPGQIHRLGLKNANGYVLCFTEDFVSLKNKESFVENFPFYDSSVTPALKLSKELSEDIDNLITWVTHEFEQSSELKADLLRSYLNIILLKLKRRFLENQNNKSGLKLSKKQRVIQFKKLINDHYLLHKTVADYADELNITPNHLNALCHKHEGKTATSLIQERMTLEAKRLLYTTEMNVKEISFYLKFENVPYFNRFFKKQAGLTPVEYRKQAQKIR